MYQYGHKIDTLEHFLTFFFEKLAGSRAYINFVTLGVLHYIMQCSREMLLYFKLATYHKEDIEIGLKSLAALDANKGTTAHHRLKYYSTIRHLLETEVRAHVRVALCQYKTVHCVSNDYTTFTHYTSFHGRSKMRLLGRLYTAIVCTCKINLVTESRLVTL